MSNDNKGVTKVWYRHDIPNKYTMAYSVTPLEDRLKVDVGLALCSPKDQFSRRMGRNVSTGRLVYKYATYGKHELFLSGRMPQSGYEWRQLEEAVVSTLGLPSSRKLGPLQLELFE